MYKIKQSPEDFVVKEIKELKVQETGKYSYYLMKKVDYTTMKALELIAKKNNLKLKDLGFAGSKDRRAITSQYISVKNKKITLQNDDIKLEFLGRGDEPISLGELEGNEFEIVIRDLDSLDINKIKEFETINNNLKNNKKINIKNYFGEQRFSKNNSDIGKAIVKKDFKKATELILENNGDYENEMTEYLGKKPNDFVGAIKLIPFKIRKMFVHAYQSYLWNEVAKDTEDETLPILGFSTENIEKYIKILEKQGITQRDFIIRQMPELSSEGGIRQVLMDISDFKILKQEEDNVTITFKLKKGSYATELIRQILT